MLDNRLFDRRCIVMPGEFEGDLKLYPKRIGNTQQRRIVGRSNNLAVEFSPDITHDIWVFVVKGCDHFPEYRTVFGKFR